MNITIDAIESVTQAYYAAVNAALPFTEYDAWSVDYRQTPAAEVRAEVERKAKAQKAVQKRIACERKVVRRAVRTLLAEGYAITVYNGEDYPVKQSTSERAIMDAVQQADEEWLNVWTRNSVGKLERFGTIFLVYGNSGPEVINDYSTNLETVLAPVNAYCDKLQDA
jgi:hypothetical protein